MPDKYFPRPNPSEIIPPNKMFAFNRSTPHIDADCNVDLENVIAKLNKIQTRQRHCDNVRFKIGGEYFPLPMIMVLDDKPAIDRLKKGLIARIQQDEPEHSPHLTVSADKSGAIMDRHPLLIIFSPNRSTMQSDAVNALSLEDKTGTQRLILPTDKNKLVGISPRRVPSEPFAVIATPSIKLIQGTPGLLNWHVRSDSHIDLSDKQADNIAILKSIATGMPRELHSHYNI